MLPRWLLSLSALMTGVLASCKTDLDCSLNGACTPSGICACDKPWSGLACEKMNFRPVTFPQGYGMTPNVTSWGGNALFDGSQYHIFVSAMTHGCTLAHWTQNSRIDHGVAKEITGPYVFSDVAIGVWAHNSAPIKLADGTFAIFHIGDGTLGPDGGQNCSHRDSVKPDFRGNAKKILYGPKSSCVHVSKSLYGPWEPDLFFSSDFCNNCNNPAPWVHQNGSIFANCQGSLIRADSLSGTWTTVSSISFQGGPPGNYEDPFLYTTFRGFHMLYHVYNTTEHPPHGHECVDSTVSAHAFSEDGHTWYISPVQPYTTQVELSSGEIITVATRERPKLFFDKHGQMTHLFNGVCGASACPAGPATGCVDCKYDNWDYTLIVPLDVDYTSETIQLFA